MGFSKNPSNLPTYSNLPFTQKKSQDIITEATFNQIINKISVLSKASIPSVSKNQLITASVINNIFNKYSNIKTNYTITGVAYYSYGLSIK
jgi:hypothetical protein